MKNFTSLSDADFGALFVNFRSSAFRLETLQRYSVFYEEAPFLDFKSGKARYTSREQGEWARLISKNVEAGKSMSRVHVIEEPLTDYIRFELVWPYVDSVQAGEDVRILPIPRGVWPAGLPKQDFWLFDSSEAAVMYYDEEGRFLRAEMTHDPVQIRQFLDWQTIAVTASMPHHDYLRSAAL